MTDRASLLAAHDAEVERAWQAYESQDGAVLRAALERVRELYREWREAGE